MNKNITQEYVLDYLLSHYTKLKIMKAFGEINLFYNPDGLLKRGVYFCTIKDKDGPNDKKSNLNRPDIFRINFGLSKTTFFTLFNIFPSRLKKEHNLQDSYQFQKLDILMPHPVYGWMSWVSILNPSQDSFENIKKLIDESYFLAVQKYNKKCSTQI